MRTRTSVLPVALLLMLLSAVHSFGATPDRPLIDSTELIPQDSSGVPPGTIGADSAHVPDSIEVEEDAGPPKRFLQLGLIAGLNARVTPGYDPDEDLDYTTGGPTGLIRLTLVPEHLLRLGFESGYMKLTAANQASQGNGAPSRLVLTAIPLLFTFAMGGEHLEVGGGVGVYRLLVSAGTTNRTTITSSGKELGYMGNISWHYPLFSKSRLGLDLRLYNFSDRPITVVVLGLSFRTPLFSL